MTKLKNIPKDAERESIFIEMPKLTEKERKQFIKKVSKKLKAKKRTGVELIMKYCSTLGSLFKYPYFFNWSTPTNHRDDTREGSFKDVSYVTFRVGKYITQSVEERANPEEMQIYFGPIFMLTNDPPLKSLMWLFKIEMDHYDSDEAIKLIKEKIDQLFEKE